MSIEIRRAEARDIDKVSVLLNEVLELHAKAETGHIYIRNNKIHQKRA